jgi:S1-C subfamily serine protease
MRNRLFAFWIIVAITFSPSLLAEHKETESTAEQEVVKQLQRVEHELEQLKQLLSQLSLRYKPIEWNDLGIDASDIDLSDKVDAFGVAAYKGGTQIVSVFPGSHAAKLNLVKGDIIVGFNDVLTQSVDELKTALRLEISTRIAGPQKLFILRNGSPYYVSLTP